MMDVERDMERHNGGIETDVYKIRRWTSQFSVGSNKLLAVVDSTIAFTFLRMLLCTMNSFYSRMTLRRDKTRISLILVMFIS